MDGQGQLHEDDHLEHHPQPVHGDGQGIPLLSSTPKQQHVQLPSHHPPRIRDEHTLTDLELKIEEEVLESPG